MTTTHSATNYIQDRFNFITWPNPLGEILYIGFTGPLFDSDTQGDIAYGGQGLDKITGGQKAIAHRPSRQAASPYPST